MGFNEGGLGAGCSLISSCRGNHDNPQMTLQENGACLVQIYTQPRQFGLFVFVQRVFIHLGFNVSFHQPSVAAAFQMAAGERASL